MKGSIAIRRLLVRAGRLSATATVAAGMLLVGASFLDWQAQHTGYELVRGLAPKTEVAVRYRNIVLPERLAARLRYQYAFSGLLPFDRPVGIYVSGSVDDASLARLAAFSRLAGSPWILHIDATATRLTDDGLERLAAFSDLQKLRIVLPAFPPDCTDAGCSVIAKLPRLREIVLSHLPVGDETAAGLVKTNSRTLRRIELNHSHVTDADLEALTQLSALRRLEARSCRATREGAWAFRMARPEVIFGGPNVPARVTQEEFQAYRRLHERLRRERGGPVL